MLTLGWGPTSCLRVWAASPDSGPGGGGESVGVVLKNIGLGEGENWLGLFWVLGQFGDIRICGFCLGFLFLCFFPLIFICMLCGFGQLLVTPWTVAHLAPLSKGFSRQVYWSWLPCPLQGIYLTQGSNWHLLHCLLHCPWILYCWAIEEALYLYTEIKKNIMCVRKSTRLFLMIDSRGWWKQKDLEKKILIIYLLYLIPETQEAAAESNRYTETHIRVTSHSKNAIPLTMEAATTTSPHPHPQTTCPRNSEKKLSL